MRWKWGVLGLALSTWLTGCAAEDVEVAQAEAQEEAVDGDAPVAEETRSAPEASRPAPAAGYYVGRQDLRRCAWPTCGGTWIRLANRTNLRCLDGSVAEECYVAQLDTEALGGADLSDFGAGRVVVRGSLARGDAGERGAYTVLRVAAAFRTEVEGRTAGEPLYLVHDAGVRCVRAPCPAPVSAQRLNGTPLRSSLTLDLTQAGASEEQLARAREALFGPGLVVAGRTGARRGSEPTLRASQLFFPVAAAPRAECRTDADCALSFYTRPVATRADCYCPTCPLPLASVEAEANTASWRALCEETHGPDTCFAAPCAPPPPVVCNAGQCMYGGFEAEAR